jgi:hypothetical protein
MNPRVVDSRPVFSIDFGTPLILIDNGMTDTERSFSRESADIGVSESKTVTWLLY